MGNYEIFANEWNNVIPYKIKESDLKMPNETILTNILINYLEQLGFSTKLLKENQNSEIKEVRHKFKVDLCAYINHLYQIDPSPTSQTFTYYDLMNPTPKKTINVLKYLLNYLLFFNMMKVEIIEPTRQKIEEYNDVRDEIECNKVKLEKVKLREKNIEQQREKYNREIPELADSIENLTVKERDQIKTMEQLKFKIESIDTRTNDLKIQRARLISKIVTDDEADTIINKMNTTKKELEEQNEVERAILEGNRQRKIAVNNLEECIKHGENFLKVCSLKDFDRHCSILKTKLDNPTTITVLENQKNQTVNIIQEKDKQIKNFRNEFQERKFKLENIKKQHQERKKELERQIVEQEDNNEQLLCKLHEDEELLMEQEEMENTIKITKTKLQPFKEKLLYIEN